MHQKLVGGPLGQLRATGYREHSSIRADRLRYRPRYTTLSAELCFARDYPKVRFALACRTEPLIRFYVLTHFQTASFFGVLALQRFQVPRAVGPVTVHDAQERLGGELGVAQCPRTRKFEQGWVIRDERRA
jgi:hypothetical protein